MTRRQEPSPRSLSSNPMSLSGRAAIIAIVAASLWSGSASAALLLPPPSSSPTLPISATGIALRAASSAVGDGRTTQPNPSRGVASSSSSPSPLPPATTAKRCGFGVGCSLSRVKSLSPLRPGGRGENSYRDPQEDERCHREEYSRWLSAVDGSTSVATSSRRRYLSEMLAASAATSLVPTILLSEEALAAAASDENDEPEECRGGAIVAESAVPGAYQQICMTLPERKIALKSTGDVLSVLQGTSAGGGTLSGRTGVAVWNSALLLARLLDATALATMEKSSPSPAGLFQGQTVLELGCGTALASIVASKLGADEVLATDGNTEVVELARTNLERNGVPSSASSSEGRGRGQAEELKWGLINAADYYDTADVVLGSDLTYNSGSWRVLAETMAAVLKQDGYVLYLALGHSGFAVSGELGGFLEVAAGEGLEAVEEYDSDRWPFQGMSLNKVLDRCVSSKERAVIESTGGVRAVVLRKKAVRKWS